jgi:uncharacterized protein YkwD
VHEVQAGEALITIARDYGTTVESIAAANALGDSELILAGQELIVPLPPGSSGAPVAGAAGAPAEPVTGTELLAQTGPLTAPLVAPAAPISPTTSLTETQGAGPEMTITQAISAASPLTDTAAITAAVPTAPLTATAGIEEPATTEPLTDTAQAEVSPELAALEEAMVAAVNAEREAHGLSAYRVDDTLSSVARAHAQDMVARDYVGHTSPEGKRVGDRLRDAGMGLDRVGENYYVTTRPAEEAVAYTLAWFMGDPPHRNNILHDYYTRIGVGVAYGPPGWYIFVLDFTGD